MILTLESSAYSFTLEACAQPVVIGRESECRVSIPETAISRKHAELCCENGEWYVQDLSSRGGTAVNGKTIAGKTHLTNGDILKLATMNFVVTLAESNTREAIGARLAGGQLRHLKGTIAAAASKPAKSTETAKKPADSRAAEGDKKAGSAEGAPAYAKEAEASATAAASAPSAKSRFAGLRKRARRGEKTPPWVRRAVFILALIILGCAGYIGWDVWEKQLRFTGATEVVASRPGGAGKLPPAGAVPALPAKDKIKEVKAVVPTTPGTASPTPEEAKK
ncbi:MAG: FHA domain-containing protein [Planctomycetota bacterium]|nr:FHA domain-containing protein [Planctomycetota bacterium]